MSDITEGLGSAVEGGLLSRALEPNSGAKEAHPNQPENCLNCGTPLTGAYCHACGQLGHVHRTIGAFMHDLLHGALHFEGKLWRTLPALAFRPGKLTRRYIEGERARFVSPMALFLFGVFLMFAVFQMIGLTAPTSIGQPDVEQVIEQVDQQNVAQRDKLREELEALPADDPERADMERRLADIEATLSGIEQVKQLDLNDEAAWNFNITGIKSLDEGIIKKWRENPGLMLYKLQANSYKFSWLLIPISIPFVWLLFAWRRRFKGYDHAIFVTYSLSFMTLLFIALSLLGAAGVPRELIFIIAPLIPPIHLYKQLRGAYQLSRFSAFWRLMVLSAFIWIVILLFLQILVVLGAY